MKNKLQEYQDYRFGKIISGAILDGQNQIHDLRSGKATPEEIEKRMIASYDYWIKELDLAILMNPTS